jgi:sulfonate transport system substrate-binding protein
LGNHILDPRGVIERLHSGCASAVYSKPERTALVTRNDSLILAIEDLKGRSVAVTRGTDPHIFLLRALDAKGLSESDMHPVLLQHPNGHRALAANRSAPGRASTRTWRRPRSRAWRSFSTQPSILNVPRGLREAISRTGRSACWRCTDIYALPNPDELRADPVEAASVSVAVAKLQLSERTDGPDHRATLLATG